MMRCDPSHAAEVLELLRASFADMDARIDPPSSLSRMGVPEVLAHMQVGEVWAIGPPLTACVFLTPQSDSHYLSKLAVHPDRRRQGLARQLVAHALTRANELGKDKLELQTRIELTENHLLFNALGFKVVAQTSHAGFDRPTSLTFSKKV